MKSFKGIITDVTDGDYQKVVNGIGRPNEDIIERSYYQHVGFTSIPPANSVGVFISDGDNVTMIASADPVANRPTLSTEKDAAIYSDENKYVKVSAGGEITIKNNNNTITLKANGDIELGASELKKLIHVDIITAMNAHTHTYNPGTLAAASTTPPTYVPPLSTVLHATTKVEAQ